MDYLSVFKIGTATLIYHLLQSLLLIGVEREGEGEGEKSPRLFIQTHFWPIKILILLGLIFGAFFIPSKYYLYCFTPFLFISVGYIIIQSLLLIDLAYGMREVLVDKAQENGFWSAFLFGFTALIYVIIFGGSVWLWRIFQDNLSRAYIIGNVGIIVAMSIISLLERVQEGNSSAGIFQSSTLGLFMWYLLASALRENATLPTIDSMEGFANRIIDGSAYLFLILTIFGVGFKTVANSPEERKDLESGSNDGDNGYFSFSGFHVIFALATTYMIMITIDWKKNEIINGALTLVNNQMSYWSKLGSIIIISGLYIWTLVAPLILPDREF